MTTEDILKLAMELGSAIAESETLETLQLKQLELSMDTEAYTLLTRFQEKQRELYQLMSDDVMPEPGQEQKLHDMEQEVDAMEQQLTANQRIQELMQAQDDFDRLMQGVYYAIDQMIEGCSGSCENCGSENCGVGA